MLGFDPDKWSIENARAMAHMSQTAYDRPDVIAAWSTFLGLKSYFIEDLGTDTQCAIFSADDAIIVAFRGTEIKYEDLKTDLDAGTIDIPGIPGVTRQGFGKAFLSVWGAVKDRVDSLREENPRPVFFTGHSLGGALATIAAATIDVAAGLFTFGSPRVGDSAFAQYVGAAVRHFRFVNNNDHIPRVPPTYSHSGTMVLITADGEIEVDPSWWDVAADRAEGFAEGGIGDGAADHAIAEYVKRLDALWG